MNFGCECGWEGPLLYDDDPCPACGSMNLAVLEDDDDVIRIGWAAEQLGLTICPGKKGASSISSKMHDRSLLQDMINLSSHADVIVNLIPDHELESLGLSWEEYDATARHVGLIPQRWAFEDNTTPLDDVGTLRFVRDLVEQLNHGVNVVVHCKGGLGRSGLIAGCAMREAGMEPSAVFDALRRARGPLCPSTADQRRYVENWPRGL